MKLASPPLTEAHCTEAWSLPRTRLADYLELTKPRIALLVLFTVAIGALLATQDVAKLPILLHTILGTALIAAGASALNQFWERHTDALMRRTEHRPLPAGRLSPGEVLCFGVGLAIVGLGYLAITVHQPLCLLVSAVTFLSYVCIYTPLKRYTTWNTAIGAVPGALPPVIGWTAMGGQLDVWIIALFLVLFFWQLPHFLAIAWIYREDYGRANLRMTPVGDLTGTRTSVRMVVFCVALVASSLIPVIMGQAGWIYACAVAGLGAYFFAAILGFVRNASTVRARQVLHASLLYLPATCLALLVQGLLQ